MPDLHVYRRDKAVDHGYGSGVDLKEARVFTAAYVDSVASICAQLGYRAHEHGAQGLAYR